MYDLIEIINLCFGAIAVVVLIYMGIDYFQFSRKIYVQDKTSEENKYLQEENEQLKLDVANLLEENRRLRDQSANQTSYDTDV